MEINFSGNNSIDVNVENGEKCFLTANTTEYNCDGCCGVTIGDNVIIGACSIVTHDIPSNSMAAGMPAKVIKQLSKEIKIC